jgi:hypothetical protein
MNRRGNEEKIAIVHVQHSGCWDNRVQLRGLTPKCRLREHAQPHDSWILNFYTHLGRANARIEDSANIADLPT